MTSPFSRVLKERFGVKVITAFIVVIAASFTLYTVVWAVYEIGRLRHKLEDQGIMLSSLLARGAVVGIFTENEAELRRVSADVLKLPDVVSVSLFNAEGRLLYQGSGTAGRTGPGVPPERQATGPPTGMELELADQKDEVRISRSVISASIADADETMYFGPQSGPARERVIGHVLIVMSKKSYRGEIAALAGRNVGLMLVFIAASGIVVWGAVRRVTRPLERLTESVRDFERGIPVEPAPVETADEIGRLASAFNDMVAARRGTERSLRESEDRYRRLVELSPDAIYVQSAGRFVFLNRAAALLLGRAEPADLLGLEVMEHIHEENRESHARRIQAVTDDQVVSSLLPVRYLLPGGAAVDAEAAAAPFAFQGQNAVLVIARDVTERKGLEAMVRNYQRELIDAEHAMLSLESRVEERERHLIAADLHDHVGQNLVLMQFRLGALQKSLSPSDATRAVEELRELIMQTIQYTRSLTVELSPPVLSEIGFTAAVETLAEGFRKSHGLTVTVADDGHPDDIPADARNLLFRSVRELLMNVVKHARARAVSIRVKRTDGRLAVAVMDDGAGFDASAAAGTMAGFGLFSIKERMKRMNGSCTIESRPGSGTTIVLEVPRDGQSGSHA